MQTARSNHCNPSSEVHVGSAPGSTISAYVRICGSCALTPLWPHTGTVEIYKFVDTQMTTLPQQQAIMQTRRSNHCNKCRKDHVDVDQTRRPGTAGMTILYIFSICYARPLV